MAIWPFLTGRRKKTNHRGTETQRSKDREDRRENGKRADRSAFHLFSYPSLFSVFASLCLCASVVSFVFLTGLSPPDGACHPCVAPELPDRSARRVDLDGADLGPHGRDQRVAV